MSRRRRHTPDPAQKTAIAQYLGGGQSGEGFEETLTQHRLGRFQALGVSLKTINCLESLNAQHGQVTDKVDRWRTSDQKQRWVASALLTIEPRLRRIKGYRHLSLLLTALQAEIRRAETRENTLGPGPDSRSHGLRHSYVGRISLTW